MRVHLLALVLTFSIANASAAQFKFPGQTFTVPDGFEVALAAGTNLVQRPVSASFDRQGRLYVTDSSGSNEKPAEQIKNPTHRVLRLEDSDGDGVFDEALVFADKVMFPQGCLWHDGSVYVAGPPSIWKFTDTDDDGVADKREEWFKGGTLTGCANDIHGPHLGPDGYLYWTKGAFAEQKHERPGRKPIHDKAAHIYRARPDGSDLDIIMSGGMDNPVEVAFTPEGEAIFTSTFIDFSQPGYRDGIAHAVYGGVFGKQNEVLEDGRVKRTGPDLLHPFVQKGPSAECGLWRYTSDVFGAEYRDNLFATSFNLHKVTRHVLRPSGATYASTDSDFLVSDGLDFHPTGVLEDADGSLLVVDTGGWYKLCCPSSQLPKPDVLGAIYRVRRKGAPKIEDPRGLSINWSKLTPAELTTFLDDKRPSVLNLAIHQLAKNKSASIPALSQTLRNSKSIDARRNAVWALTQIDGLTARQAVYNAFPTGANSYLPSDDSAAQVAMYSIGLWRDTNAIRAPRADDFSAVVAVSDALASSNPSMRRAAVQTFGRIGEADKNFAVGHLLHMPELQPVDRVLEHSLIYALIELNDPQSTANGLTNRLTQRAALIALDQMDSGGLKLEQVTPLLTSPDPLLKQAASWIVGRHTEWGDALAGFFRERLSTSPLSASDRAEVERQLAQLARSSAIQGLLIAMLGDDAAAKEAKLSALRAMAGAALKQTPAGWARQLSQVLSSTDAEIVKQAVATARALAAPKEATTEFAEALLHVARDTTQPSGLRLDALAAVPGRLPALEPMLFDFLCAHVGSAQPVTIRGAAAGALAKAKLSADQLLALTETLKEAGPLEMTKLLGAFEKATNEALGLKLVATLKESKSLNGLHTDALRPRLTNFPTSVQQEGEALLAMLNTDAAQQKKRLEELLVQIKNGDIRRGQAIFNSAKAACSACHAIGYLGGKIGPDLTSISQARTERDLLESIVYPSASFVRSYEPMIVVTKSGEEHSGALRKDAPDEVVLATGPDTEARIARSDIAEMRPGTISVMPQGLEEQLSRQELADLLAFLKNTKWGPQ